MFHPKWMTVILKKNDRIILLKSQEATPDSVVTEVMLLESNGWVSTVNHRSCDHFQTAVFLSIISALNLSNILILAK